MISLIILALIIVMLTIAAVLVLSIGGTLWFVVFGDLFVCVVAIVWIVRKITKQNKK